MSAAEQLDPIDMVVRPVTPNELSLVAATWTRSYFQRERLAVPEYDATGYTPRDDFGNVLAEQAVYGSLGSPDSPRSMLVHRDVIERMAKLVIGEILAHPTTRIDVACLPDLAEPMGWACWSGQLLHYVFVRKVSRKQRVATRLVHHTGCSAASHVTPTGRALLRHLRGGT